MAYIAKQRAGTVSTLGIPQVEQSDELTDLPEGVDFAAPAEAAESSDDDEELADDIPDL